MANVSDEEWWICGEVEAQPCRMGTSPGGEANGRGADSKRAEQITLVVLGLVWKACLPSMRIEALMTMLRPNIWVEVLGGLRL